MKSLRYHSHHRIFWMGNTAKGPKWPMGNEQVGRAIAVDLCACKQYRIGVISEQSHERLQSTRVLGSADKHLYGRLGPPYEAMHI